MNNDRTYDLLKGPKVEVITQVQRRRRWSETSTLYCVVI